VSSQSFDKNCPSKDAISFYKHDVTDEFDKRKIDEEALQSKSRIGKNG
jgi:hypothetical protein